jgi:hypothetical protein
MNGSYVPPQQAVISLPHQTLLRDDLVDYQAETRSHRREEKYTILGLLLLKDWAFEEPTLERQQRVVDHKGLDIPVHMVPF